MRKMVCVGNIRTYEDDRGWVNLEDTQSRSMMRIKTEDWTSLSEVVGKTLEILRKEGKLE